MIESKRKYEYEFSRGSVNELMQTHSSIIWCQQIIHSGSFAEIRQAAEFPVESHKWGNEMDFGRNTSAANRNNYGYKNNFSGIHQGTIEDPLNIDLPPIKENPY